MQAQLNEIKKLTVLDNVSLPSRCNIGFGPPADLVPHGPTPLADWVPLGSYPLADLVRP